MPTDLVDDDVVLDDDVVVIDEADITEYLDTNKKILEEINNSEENNNVDEINKLDEVKSLQEDEITILKDILKNLTEINKDFDKTNEQFAIALKSEETDQKNNDSNVYINVLVFFFTFIIGFLIVKAFFSMIHK